MQKREIGVTYQRFDFLIRKMFPAAFIWTDNQTELVIPQQKIQVVCEAAFAEFVRTCESDLSFSIHIEVANSAIECVLVIYDDFNLLIVLSFFWLSIFDWIWLAFFVRQLV